MGKRGGVISKVMRFLQPKYCWKTTNHLVRLRYLKGRTFCENLISRMAERHISKEFNFADINLSRRKRMRINARYRIK